MLVIILNDRNKNKNLGYCSPKSRCDAEYKSKYQHVELKREVLTIGVVAPGSNSVDRRLVPEG